MNIDLCGGHFIAYLKNLKLSPKETLKNLKKNATETQNRTRNETLNETLKKL